MTSRTALELPENSITPTDEEVRLARESSRQLAKLTIADQAADIKMTVRDNGEETAIVLPKIALQLLKNILVEMAKGNAMTLIPIHAELTTQQAADILNVSRPFLISLLEKGEIGYTKVGTHRRVKFQSLMDYKHCIDTARERDLCDLAEQAQRLGLGY